jgi:hypothetical protein
MAKLKFTQRKAGMAATVRVDVTVWEENYEAIKMYAEASGLSVREWIEDACSDGIYRRLESIESEEMEAINDKD